MRNPCSAKTFIAVELILVSDWIEIRSVRPGATIHHPIYRGDRGNELALVLLEDILLSVVIIGPISNVDMNGNTLSERHIL